MNLHSAFWTTLVALLLLSPSAVPSAQAETPPVLFLVDAWVAPPGVGDLPEPPGLPLPPTDLRARIDGAAVELVWDAPLDGAPAAYRVYRLDAPNGGAEGPPAGLPAFWQPLQQVPGNTTTLRDTTVDLSRQHYVYAVTAVDAPPGLPGWSAATTHTGPESPPSDPAYTWNTFMHCSWFDLNLPHMSSPPTVHPECIFSNSTVRPPVVLGLEIG